MLPTTSLLLSMIFDLFQKALQRRTNTEAQNSYQPTVYNIFKHIILYGSKQEFFFFFLSILNKLYVLGTCPGCVLERVSAQSYEFFKVKKFQRFWKKYCLLAFRVLCNKGLFKSKILILVPYRQIYCFMNKLCWSTYKKGDYESLRFRKKGFSENACLCDKDVYLNWI